jgi:hypothetical protein
MVDGHILEIAGKAGSSGHKAPDFYQPRINPVLQTGKSRAPVKGRRFSAGRLRFFGDPVLV